MDRRAGHHGPDWRNARQRRRRAQDPVLHLSGKDRRDRDHHELQS
jgi:hypothetical protein